MTANILPRLGFLGTGWIGRHRLEALHASGEAEVAAIADICPENAREASRTTPGAAMANTLDELLRMGLDGIVIATPSACHCEQTIRALEAGCAVFCQKPLGRNVRETKLAVHAARSANRLLGVDFSYRFTEGVQRMREAVRSGQIGSIYAADLIFHNAYGPDKEWFYDRERSGGGCLMDLGSHLVDLALWFFDFQEVREVHGSLYAGGKRLAPRGREIEDYAATSLVLEDGSIVRLACSWNVSAGQDAVIEATFFGTEGGVSFRNIGGSFYDFHAERFRGTTRETLAVPPDDWGGRAALAWCRRLRETGGAFDPVANELVRVAATLDAAYGL